MDPSSKLHRRIRTKNRTLAPYRRSFRREGETVYDFGKTFPGVEIPVKLGQKGSNPRASAR
jgi:hypothetical protein